MSTKRTRQPDAIVAGVDITHPDRVVYPKSGLTKFDLAEYIVRIAPLMLPHVAGRPLALVRCPEGSAHQCFFQKHWPGTPPAALDTVLLRQKDGRRRKHIVVHNTAGLVTLMQWGVMEIHTWGARAGDPDRPDRVIFDLDPGPGVAWAAVRRAAGDVRATLRRLGLESWVKTSGGKGLHVVVPIQRRSSWDEASRFARGVAESVAKKFPERYVSTASKSARRGVVFIDWLRNVRGATSVAPWSPRARARAGVSVPVAWPQLGRVTAGDHFTVPGVRAHPPQRDAWTALLVSRQGLTRQMFRRLEDQQ